jgi:RNA polymerase sigma-70 factor (ECF subfamily)
MEFRDTELFIEQLKRGNESAFLYLVDRYHIRLHAYAMTLTGDRAMSQDLVQNVFLKTWQFRKKLDSQYSIQSFLYKSVYNEFLNDYQKNRSMMLLQRKYLDSLEEVLERTDDTALSRMVALVNREIKNLPPKCQRVFMMSKKEGLSNYEIAEYLDVSVKSVEAHITKAFGILRKKLGQKYETVLFLVFASHTNSYSME